MAHKYIGGRVAMVKLGFIGEGANEKSVLESNGFRSLLNELNLAFVEKVIDAKGGGNLLPKYLQDQVEQLQKEGATHILILADKEDAPCITSVKARIDPDGNHIVIIAVKAIEAWFLADHAAMSAYLKSRFICENPEEFLKPFDYVRELRWDRTGRGLNHKKQLCSHLLLNGFSLQNAASHPNCPSATYFLEKLKSLAGIG